MNTSEGKGNEQKGELKQKLIMPTASNKSSF
jgi:hypothetical protein